MFVSVASGTVKKVIEINKYLLGTMAGGAADCQYWYVPFTLPTFVLFQNYRG